MIFSVYAALHALFDRTQHGQPTGWYWIMKDETLLQNMYQAYCLDGHAGMRLDPESVSGTECISDKIWDRL